MAQSWTSSSPHDFWDAYLDWTGLIQARREALLPPPQPTPDRYQPIFIRLKPVGQPATIEAARAALSALVNDPAAPVVMDPHEYDFLQERLSRPGTYPGLPDEYALYRKLGTANDYQASLWLLLDVGSTVNLDPGAIPVGTAGAVAEPATGRKPKKTTPIVAIIDDGIGFLNARFRRRQGKGYGSRFEAIWLQAIEEAAPRQGDAPRRVYLGEVLTRRDIDAYLDQGAAPDEWAVYSALNARLCRIDERRSTDFALTHGTHVLDLAAGADPDDASNPARDWPLLGVQLPASAVEDTSGTKFENYMVQGIRWILRQAAQIDPKAPVIVNLSMGILAGPKDGTRFTEYQVAREAKLWEEVTGQPVRVVWSFGNAYRGNLVTRFGYDAGSAAQDSDRHLTWRIQPGDQTASFVEIHTDPATPSTALQIALTTPDGVASGFAPIPPGEYRSLMRNGAAVARLYHVPEHPLDDGQVRRAHHVLAVAQTDNKLAGEALATAGAWTIGLRYEGADEAAVHLQVQRDESLAGYRPGARQSYFDAPGAYGWDKTLQDWSHLADDCPIEYADSLSALTTAGWTPDAHPPVPVRQVFTVGAVERDTATDSLPPSLYTAEGAEWTMHGPVGSTVADDGRLFWGVLAAGTYTDSARLLNGTSVAAGRMTRALAMCAPTIVANAAQGGGNQIDDLDPAVLPLVPVPAAAQTRLGPVTVDIHAGARPRN
ncbi:S8 family serine peptidase [Aestuariicoccus sp. MJ-SS9]|uniref:S8 family serine peptidase n=1 Tax=Aestuariicoccus sp. MJ-SS9 TaxID=3079855 RepID=UPI002906E52E|nr:S8 family serine peptidase [Aestuariicoccus sp. MJ-SS9]MDU8912426.1 hypothetical protein [Aestuariicoccus sp. MJ-SS9]